MDKKPNLTIDEVARWLDVNPRTVYRLIQRKEIPGFKVGGQWRVNQAMLNDWVQRSVEKNTESKNQKP